MERTNTKRRTSRFREQSKCRFCRDFKGKIDYKSIDVLSKLLTAQGKVFSRKRSGNCAACQRRVTVAIKRARFIALLPYIG
jgi:small subunit ribosomal protein S18